MRLILFNKRDSVNKGSLRKFIIINICYNRFSSEQEYPAARSAAMIEPADVPATRSHS